MTLLSTLQTVIGVSLLIVLHEAGPDLPPDIVNRERASATA